jgi:hypothetical protein
MSSPYAAMVFFNIASSVSLISFSNYPSQTSTSSVILIGFFIYTYSLAELIMEVIYEWFLSKSTLYIPAKSFFKWLYMTTGFFACPNISNKSSSPMK